MTFALTKRLWSDDSEEVVPGFRDLGAAVTEAERVFLDDDITEVTVRRVRSGKPVGPVLFWLAVGPGACPLCGWPAGQGHAPGARCEPGASDGPTHAAAAFAAMEAITDGEWDRFLIRLTAAIRARSATGAYESHIVAGGKKEAG